MLSIRGEGNRFVASTNQTKYQEEIPRTLFIEMSTRTVCLQSVVDYFNVP